MKIIETLIERGCNPFIKNNCGCTALFNVVYYGFDKVCDEMLALYKEKFGLSKTLEYINSQDNEDKTALMYGAKEGKKSYNCVLILLKWNADTKILDNHGWNAFTYASYHGNFETCQVLLSQTKDFEEPSVSEELDFNISNKSPDSVNKMDNQNMESISNFKTVRPKYNSNSDYYNNVSSNIMNRMILRNNVYNDHNNDSGNYDDLLNNPSTTNPNIHQMLSDSIINNNDPQKYYDGHGDDYESGSNNMDTSSIDGSYKRVPQNSKNSVNPNGLIYEDNINEKYSYKSSFSSSNNNQGHSDSGGKHSYDSNYNNIEEYSSVKDNFNNKYSIVNNKSNYDFYMKNLPQKIDPYYYSNNINDSYFDDFSEPINNNMNINPESQYYYDGNTNLNVNRNNNQDITNIYEDDENYNNLTNEELNEKINNYNNVDHHYALIPFIQGKLQAKIKKFQKFKWKLSKSFDNYDYNGIEEDNIPEQWKSVYEDYQHTKTAFKLHHWSGFTKCMTCWIPSYLLKKLGIKENTMILAWREKFTLCLIIAFISLMLFLVNIGLFSFLCRKVENWDPIKINNLHGFNSGSPWIYIRGQIYDLNYIYEPSTKTIKSSYIPQDPVQKSQYQSIIQSYLGKDLSYLIPPNISNPEKAAKCKRWPMLTNHGIWCDINNNIYNGINYCHTSNNTRHYLGVMKTSYYLTYTYDKIKQLNKKKENHIVFLGNKIYNMTSYFEQSERYLGEFESNYLLKRKGYDIAYFVHNKFMIGKLEGQTEGCLISYIIMILYESV
ncbi:ankyrin [Neocallimastix californiae]|uniref:Ankyrin n=1 Tax=Neocallimastix californiae TaxID=1754190 RepID=A0A1Y2EUI0_9FUNG|nr:ankyrin [Neocallimastix californiae]|eukprot:ORY75218.1 ankyrin [Neocallimastix californiae]